MKKLLSGCLSVIMGFGCMIGIVYLISIAPKPTQEYMKLTYAIYYPNQIDTITVIKRSVNHLRPELTAKWGENVIYIPVDESIKSVCPLKIIFYSFYEK